VGNRWLVPATGFEYVCTSSAVSAATWSALGGASVVQEHYMMWQQETTATSGGTTTKDVWGVRPLNNLTSAPVGGASVSLATNAFTLTAGRYVLSASVVFSQVVQVVLRLRQTSGTPTTIATGLTAKAASGAVTLDALFIVAATETFQLEHNADTTVSGSGMGLARGLAGIPEVYAQVRIDKF
jgi:hypothetical protein